MFSDNDGNLQHEFIAGQNYNTVSLAAGASVTLILNWDAYPTTNIDYNLYLYNGNPASGGAIVASSSYRQSGNSSSYPYEALNYTAPSGGTYYVVVTKARGSTSHVDLTLFSLGPNFSQYTTASSLAQPADCQSVLSVAAVNLQDGLESFSAEGPTTDGRQKPDVAAPNRVQTYFTSSFSGTSAAAPHATGAAALILAQNPAFNSRQLRGQIIADAFDVAAAGYDYRTGYGRISLDADLDTYNHDLDNCVLIANVDQADFDNDGFGDVCDIDIDNDGLENDIEEQLSGTSVINPDTDGDGLTDGEEVNGYSTDPLMSNLGDLAPINAPDNVLDVTDLLRMQRIILGYAVPTLLEQGLADINQDGLLDIRDSLLLTKHMGYN
jgi:hypothetical protein